MKGKSTADFLTKRKDKINPFKKRNSLSQFSLSCTNIRSMCAEDSKASDLKLRTIVNLKTDISILIDSHLDKRGLETLTKGCKISAQSYLAGQPWQLSVDLNI